VFAEAAPLYDNALSASGYADGLTYIDPKKTSKKKRSRRRDIVWFNPPFSKNVRTNVGGRFLSLVSKHFKKGSKLAKIFNRNTVKISCVKFATE